MTPRMYLAFVALVTALLGSATAFAPLGSRMATKVNREGLVGKARAFASSKILKMAVTDAPPDISR